MKSDALTKVKAGTHARRILLHHYVPSPAAIRQAKKDAQEEEIEDDIDVCDVNFVLLETESGLKWLPLIDL